jgi:hypothetical protein
MRLKTYLTTCIGRLYKRLLKKRNSVWIEVPLSCSSADEKNIAILSAIEIMERTIIIKNK